MSRSHALPGCVARPASWLILLVATAGAAAAQTPATSSARHPQVTFATPGSKTVSLRTCNALGCSTTTRTVQVLDPAPKITSATVSASSVEPGQTVTLSGTALGRPPLTSTWTIRRGSTLVATLTGATAVFATGGQPPGAYSITLTATNPYGPAASSAPLPLTLVTATATDFYTVPPCRLFDTRAGFPLFGGLARPVQTVGRCGIPAGVRALVANVTVVNPSSGGFVVLYPGNLQPPGTSTIPFPAGVTRATAAVLPLANDGSGSLLALAPTTGISVDLVVDVSGYFAASP